MTSLFNQDLGPFHSFVEQAFCQQSSYHRLSWEEAFKALRHAIDTLPLFALFHQPPLNELWFDHARYYRERFSHIVVLGTGGSNLAGQAFNALRLPTAPRLTFLDSIDPHTVEELVASLDFSQTGFLVISKSGRTLETTLQMLFFLEQARDSLLEETIKDHFLLITGPGNHGLRYLASSYNIPIFPHPGDIGGRFSAFTIVGLFPAFLAGLNLTHLYEGAQIILEPIQRGLPFQQIPAVQGAALGVFLADKGVNMSVMMPYIDRLVPFTRWYRQLWGESLGKEGHGTTPVLASGPVDQHSQLQLYLEGPLDKLITFFTLTPPPALHSILSGSFQHPDLALLKGQSLGSVMEAEQKATYDTLVQKGRYVRAFRLTELNEKVLGGLMMHFILETLLTAFLFKIHPFNQPAVELSKQLALHYLQKKGPFP